MLVIKTIAELRQTLDAHRRAQRSIGLVPTMGALHQGHASLVRRSVDENDVTVVSDFVNPTQFNDPTDLSSYPRDLDADLRLLQAEGATIVFAPSVAEMYPEPDTRHFSYPGIDNVMEGARRPGHFNGVCQIVSKLLFAVEPHRAYFGEKDFQQITVIRAMVSDLQLPVSIVACPIVREADGLALSSRNSLLTPAERSLAVNISRALFISKDYARTHSVGHTFLFVVRTLNAIEGLRVEYFDIVDASSLRKVQNWDEAEHIQGCITVYCGSRPTRLIDNICYK